MDPSNAPRLTTGIPGLDPILEGGLLVGGVYLVQGPPGSGKTILANQLCCHQARAGNSAIYFTLLSESHTGMLAHLKRMAFFCGEVVGSAVVYFSGYKVLEADGLGGLARLIGQTMTERGAKVLIIDGFMTASEHTPIHGELKQFVRQLQTFSASLRCTTLLLSSSCPPPVTQSEHTIVDGIIELSDDLNGMRSLRHLQVRKMRGTRQLRGRHTVEITDQGMALHARFETGSERSRNNNATGTERLGFGIRELDTMMNGGVPSGSVTMVLGPSGTGKTMLSLQFLGAGAATGDIGLYFGMYEHPEALIAKTRRIGMSVADAVEAGKIHLVWERPIEGVLDIIADRLIKQVRDCGARRLCIDGMHTLFRTVDFPERMRAVAAALAEELAALGVTTLYTLETPDLIAADGASVRVPIDDLSALSHNMIVIRSIERAGQFDRMLSIMKMRDSDYDRSIRELTITARGIAIAPRARRPRGHAAARQSATRRRGR
jgi:circadian clock protein KaiC